MAAIVSILGVLSTLIGIMGVVRPAQLVGLINRLNGRTRFWTAVLVRMVLGIVFLLVAPACRLTVVVQVLGVIAIIAAVGILVVGQTRLDSFIGWWLARPELVRVSAVFACCFGALLIYAGA